MIFVKFYVPVDVLNLATRKSLHIYGTCAIKLFTVDMGRVAGHMSDPS